MGRITTHLNMSSAGPTTATASSLRTLFRAHYQKLVNDYPYPEYGKDKDTPRFVPPAPASTPAPLPESLSFCCRHCGHSDKLQAEELNSIVGNAFRMAYAAQLQRQEATLSLGKPLGPLNNNISSNNNNNSTNNNNNINSSHDLHHTWAQQLIASPSPLPSPSVPLPPPLPLPPAVASRSPAVMSRVSRGLPLKSQASASTVSTTLNPCSPESDDSNSPTELNSYRRLGEKPPLIKRLAMGLTGRESVDEDAAPLVAASVVESPTNNNLVEDSPIISQAPPLSDSISKHVDVNVRLSQSSHTSTEISDLKTKRISQISSCSGGVTSGTGVPCRPTPTPPPLPERTDSLTCRPEDGDLRAAPWFQAGIPREIALEVLGRESVGAFMVRESTTKLGCFALSLRVPRDFQPSGIAHYLILRTNKGYKIKGFTKEFSSLLALITHHSVMPELLPVPLALSRKHINSSRTETSRDFADVDTDPDYNTLADFRKMMADLNV